MILTLGVDVQADRTVVAWESVVFQAAELTASEKGGEVILRCWRH